MNEKEQMKIDFGTCHVKSGKYLLLNNYHRQNKY